MDGEKKINMNVNNLNSISEDELISIIDSMMDDGVSRLKVKGSDEINRGELLKEYHHGRCDIGSPWAKGKAFDVLE